MNRKHFQLFHFLMLTFIAFALKGCQEFIHDSFDTFQGEIVDREGVPISNLELSLYSDNSFFFNFPFKGSPPIYTLNTNSRGEFKMVLPSKFIDDTYFLAPSSSSYIFELEQFDTIVTEPYLILQGSLRDTNGVIDLGSLTVVNNE